MSLAIDFELPQFIPIFKGIEDHLENGEFSLPAFGLYVLLHVYCNYETGIMRSTSGKLRERMHATSPEWVYQQALQLLRQNGLINYPEGTGDRSYFPILINKYLVRTGPLKGWTLNAFAKDGLYEPVYDKDESGPIVEAWSYNGGRTVVSPSTHGGLAVDSGSPGGGLTVDSRSTDGELAVASESTSGELTDDSRSTDGELAVDLRLTDSRLAVGSPIQELIDTTAINRVRVKQFSDRKRWKKSKTVKPTHQATREAMETMTRVEQETEDDFEEREPAPVESASAGEVATAPAQQRPRKTDAAGIKTPIPTTVTRVAATTGAGAGKKTTNPTTPTPQKSAKPPAPPVNPIALAFLAPYGEDNLTMQKKAADMNWDRRAADLETRYSREEILACVDWLWRDSRQREFYGNFIGPDPFKYFSGKFQEILDKSKQAARFAKSVDDNPFPGKPKPYDPEDYKDDPDIMEGCEWIDGEPVWRGF